MTYVDHHGYRVHDDGRIESKRHPGVFLSPETVKGGYLRVKLSIGGQQQHHLVHVLVAAAFIGPRPEGKEVNHKDGIKTNNAVANLEYVTPSENVRHSIAELGVQRAKGSANGWARLTEELVREMRKRAAKGESAAALAREFNVHHTTAHRAISGIRWSHVA
jgi:hypothetical protein